MRGPGADSVSAQRLEQVSGPGVEFGIVGYTHAGGVDRPLIAWKGGDIVVPHMNWRGLFGRGTNLAGTAAHEIEWPGERMTATYINGPTQAQTRLWFGGVLEGQRDAGGAMYMRNRYYDPATGQFTQTDPIGIAGGLNTYGFAAGDPVSYSDPYGLCPGIPNTNQWNLFDCPPGWITLGVSGAGGAAGGLAGGVTGGLAGAAACAPTAAGALVCAAGGAAAGASAGAKAGAAAGFLVGSAVEAGIWLSKGLGEGGSQPEMERGETANFNHAVRQLGIDRTQASAELHRIKQAERMGGADNVWINTRTGAVRSQKTGEVIGNLFDGH